MGQLIVPASTNVSLYFNVVEDSGGTNPGEPKTGLVFGDIDDASYVFERSLVFSITPITLAAINSAHSDGGFIEVDATKQPGVYRFDIPDAAVTGNNRSIIKLVFAAAKNAIAEPLVVDLTPIDNSVWDALISGHNVAGSFGQAFFGGHFSTAGGAPTTTVVRWNGTGATDDMFIGYLAVFRSGAAIDQARRVIDYDAGSKDLTLDPPLTIAPSSGDSLLLIPDVSNLDELIGPELAQAAPLAIPTQRAALMLVNMIVRNEIVTGTGSQDFKNDAGTIVFKRAISFASGPKITTFDELGSGP